ncbi:MAG: hypothetical protein HY741_28705 [Chloroflexi bacterium]|nr:hypothetical protein [Chloroflexota bacterium]
MTKHTHFSLSLDTLLLLLLTPALLWFNPVSNALAVVLLALYVVLGWIYPQLPDELAVPQRANRIAYLARIAIIFFVIMLATLLPTAWFIMLRHADGPETHATDGLIQTETAIQFLLDGKNPYTENYFGTPLEKFPGREPPLTMSPLYHFAYLPFLVIGSIPFYLSSYLWLGWYDQRFPYLLLYGIMLLALPALASPQRNKLSLLIAVGLNFLFGDYLAEGRNDIVVLCGLVITTALVARGWIAASALVLGLMLATKHSAFFFLPFYLCYLLPAPITTASLRKLVWRLLPLAIAVAVLILPFLFWDAASFYDDTVTYITGSGPNAFPIKGWGFGALMLFLQVIPTPDSAFPFGLFELVFGLPTLFFLLRYQRRENTLSQMWLGFAIFSFVVEFFSRFFADNYVIFILQALVIAVFIAPTRREEEA